MCYGPAFGIEPITGPYVQPKAKKHHPKPSTVKITAPKKKSIQQNAPAKEPVKEPMKVPTKIPDNLHVDMKKKKPPSTVTKKPPVPSDFRDKTFR